MASVELGRHRRREGVDPLRSRQDLHAIEVAAMQAPSERERRLDNLIRVVLILGVGLALIWGRLG